MQTPLVKTEPLLFDGYSLAIIFYSNIHAFKHSNIQTFKHSPYGIAHRGVIVVEEGAVGAVGDDEADRQCVVSHDLREAVDGGGLHLKVGDLQSVL